ncbi:MAG: alpha/beta hydrolase [Planctomycetota bacterium]|nr:alpha/beta hydrolase [Planctomycetota bacterium]
MTHHEAAASLLVAALATCLSFARPSRAADAADKAPFPGKKSAYRGCDRYDFKVADRPVLVVAPKQPAPGKLWVWRAEFFDAFPGFDVAMLEKGYYLVYMDVSNMYGGPQALKLFDALYAAMTEQHGFSKKPILEGLSRGGLFVFNWAARHPDSVGCVYGDGAVCDFKSWPGGKMKGKGSPGDWQQLIKVYGFKDEAEALAYNLNPVDNLEPLAKAKVPVLMVSGDADDVVPHTENTMVVKERYEKLGGIIEVHLKPKGGHHPHGLPDPAPAVEFVLKNALK